MAQIDIGKLTFTHKGDYAGGTAYVANDVVYYNGSAYIAKTSTTGNLPTSTAHWNVFATGSGGIWNAGLSLGTAGQVVKVNSGASALEFGTISTKLLGQKIVTDQTGINMGNINRSMYNITQLGLTYTTQSTASYFVVRCHLHLAHENHQKGSIEWSKDNSNWYHPSEAGNAGFDASAYTPTGHGISWSSDLKYRYPQMGVAPYTDPNRHEPTSCAFVLTPSSTHSASTIYLRVGSFVSNSTADAMYNRTNGNSANDGTIAQSSIEIVEYKL